MTSLAIIIPYRDRQAHLDEFLPAFAAHAARYPSRIPSDICIKIIEQTAGREFNRGKINNVGFALSGIAEYVCFHDVDYCPVRADYRPTSPNFWAHVAYRASERVIDPRGLDISHGPEFAGGVVLFGRKEFERVNGFSNSYWGWGPEDADLRNRCAVRGLGLDRRRGRFHLIPHDNAGYELIDGDFIDSAASTRNKALFASRWPDQIPSDLTGCGIATDGLSSLNFDILSRQQWPLSANLPVEKITVAI